MILTSPQRHALLWLYVRRNPAQRVDMKAALSTESGKAMHYVDRTLDSLTPRFIRERRGMLELTEDGRLVAGNVKAALEDPTRAEQAPPV